MADKGKSFDWLSGMASRTREAYKPDPFAGILQSLKQGFIGKKITEDKLREAMMTMMMGTHTPMVGETPATPEQIAAGIKGKPGVISSLFGAKSPEELTWKPLPVEWKPTSKEEKLEMIKAGKTDPKEFEYILKSALAEQRHMWEKELIKLRAELTGPLDEAKRKKIEKETERIEENIKMYRDTEEAPEGNLFDRLLEKVGLKRLGTETPETPTEQLDLGIETPPPTETLIPDWLPEEVKARVRTLQEAGATEEEIQAVIDYYRQ